MDSRPCCCSNHSRWQVMTWHHVGPTPPTYHPHLLPSSCRHVPHIGPCLALRVLILDYLLRNRNAEYKKIYHMPCWYFSTWSRVRSVMETNDSVDFAQYVYRTPNSCDNTLDDAQLERHCPLGNGRHDCTPHPSPLAMPPISSIGSQ